MGLASSLRELIPHLRHTLLHWYAQHQRPLPWRTTRDPYAIWISEVMLQQTQVVKVIPYYQRWLAALPTVVDVAQSSREQILKLWEGLGYYRRARAIHAAAQVILRDYQGHFPRTLPEVMALPGIGRTTAGGILSAAFNLPYPILDGNVRRVLARLVALPLPPAQALGELWALSEALLDPDSPRDFNQALMDLGATLCRPRQPRCHHCPWQDSCCAYNQGQQHEIPMTTPAPPRPHRQIAVGIVFRRDGQVLIAQRPETSMLGGLWEFPGGKVEPGESLAACVERELLEEVGIHVQARQELATVEHAYTHFSITLTAYLCRYLSGQIQPLQCADVRWIDPQQLKDYPFPMANQKLFPYLDPWLRDPDNLAGLWA
ncbi:MAG: A/G-specific adenine glycosylase [Thermostichales cyanobacterium HHBFW_bins_127]